MWVEKTLCTLHVAKRRLQQQQQHDLEFNYINISTLRMKRTCAHPRLKKPYMRNALRKPRNEDDARLFGRAHNNKS